MLKARFKIRRGNHRKTKASNGANGVPRASGKPASSVKLNRQDKISNRHRSAGKPNGAIAKIDGTDGPVSKRRQKVVGYPADDLEFAIQRYSDLYDFAPVPYVSFDRTGRIVEANLAASQLFRRRRDLLIGLAFSIHVFDQDADLFLRHLVRCRRSAETVTTDLRLKTRKGEIIFAQISTTPIKTAARQTETLLFQTTVVDLTNRKKIERLLTEQAHLLDLSTDAIFVRGANDRIIYWNRGAEQLYGYTQEEALGKIVHELLRTQLPEKLPKILEKLRSRQRWEGELVQHHKDGTELTTFSRWSLHDDPTQRDRILETNTDITEQKRVARTLRQREEFLRRLIDTAPMWIQVIASDGTVLQMNTSGAHLLDATSPSDFEGKCVYDLVAPEYRDQFRKFNRNICRGTRGSMQFEIEGLKGTRRIMETYASPFRWFDGRRVMLGIANDITDRKEAEALIAEAVRQRESLLQFVQRRSSARTLDEIYAVALDTIIETLRCDRASILLFDDNQIMRFVDSRGLSEPYRQAVEGHSPWKSNDKKPQPFCVEDIENADLAPAVKKATKREGIRAAAFIPVMAEGRLIGEFITYYHAPHQCSPEELTISLNIAGQLGLGVERKRAENALRKSEERHRGIVNQSVAGLAETDVQGRFRMVNQRYCEISGYAQEDLLGGLRMQDITHPKDLPNNERLFEKCVNEGESFTIEKRYIRKDKSVVDVHNSVSAIRDSNGKVQGIAAVCIDITDRKRAEDALRESEQQMRAIVEQTVAGIARSDADGRIFFVNQRFCEMVGYRQDEVLGRTTSQLTHPADQKRTDELFKRLLKKGEAFELEKRYLRKDGSSFWVNVSAAPVRDASDKIRSVVAIVLDISERKEAEGALRRSKEMLEELVQQRTHALRQSNQELEDEIQRRRGLEGQILEISDREQQRLAQELHDGLCQELTAIGFMARATSLRLKNHRVLLPEDVDQIATLINRAAANARNISRALHRVDLDAAGFVDAIESLVKREIWKTPCRVEMKEGFQIHDDKAAVNLYGIAREAVLNANKHAQARQIVIQIAKSKGEIILAISDDGVGLKQRTKESLGMGLNIMDYRARTLGGRLEVESQTGKGTRITCYLPVKE